LVRINPASINPARISPAKTKPAKTKPLKTSRVKTNPGKTRRGKTSRPDRLNLAKKGPSPDRNNPAKIKRNLVGSPSPGNRPLRKKSHRPVRKKPWPVNNPANRWVRKSPHRSVRKSRKRANPQWARKKRNPAPNSPA
jgi:hypothetical protein